jgi:hexulose-6-phosphate isomerase
MKDMKKGVNIWSFDASLSLEQCFKQAKKAGFEGVELALAESNAKFDGMELALVENGEINLNSSREEVEKIAACAKDNGIELYSLASGLSFRYSPTASDPAVREKAQMILHKQIEIASWLGCETILVIPGFVNADFVANCEIVEYDVAYERGLDYVKKGLPFAEEKKIELGIENVWNKFLLSPLEMRDFIDSFNNPFSCAYFDVGNVLYSGYPEHWIKILNKRIKKVHIKDYRRAAGGLHGFVDLLSGDVNFPAVMEALKAIGYDGWLTTEIMPPYKHYPEQTLLNTSLSLDKIINN